MLRHLDAQQKPPDWVWFFMCQILAPASMSILIPSPVLPGVAGGVDLVHAVEVTLHLEVVLVAAAGEQDALLALDGVLVAVGIQGHHAASLRG